MSFTVFGSAQPIYTFGESHCMALGNTLFEWAPGEIFMCRSRFMPYLKAHQYMENGKLHPSLIEALNGERLLDEKGRPKFLDENVSFAYYSGVPVMPPPMLFFAGDMDLHMNLFKEWGDRYDFILPGDETYGIDKSRQPVSLGAVCKKIEIMLSPFTQALLQLRDMGFSRLMVHCLPARSNNPKKAYWLGFDYALRAKLTIVANSFYAGFCQRENIGYIDNWGETMENGYLKPEYDLDGGHLVKSATLITIQKIMEHMYGRTAYSFNRGRYDVLRERSASMLKPRPAGFNQSWADKAIAWAVLDSDAAGRLNERLNFEVPKCEFTRLDWVEFLKDREGVQVAALDAVHLEVVHGLLSEGLGDQLLHAGAQGELTVCGLRPVRVASNAQASPVLAPPGLRRAVLHLQGAGRLIFTSAGGEEVERVILQRGMLVVFDPSRVACHYHPLSGSMELVEITAIGRVPKHPFRIISAGIKDCPVDPFSYSLQDTLSFPPLPGERFLERARPPTYNPD